MTTKTFDRHTAKFLAVIGENIPEDLSGEEMQRWIENPKSLQEVLRKAFQPLFKTWKTIKIGELKSASEYREAIEQKGCQISDWANDILGKIDFTELEETEIELVLISVSELGYKKGNTRKAIYERAQELGLELCPPEVGLQLRVDYQDQPNREWILIAMDPIAVSDGGLGVFRLARNVRDLWLNGHYGIPAYFWGGDCRWVFARRKKPLVT